MLGVELNGTLVFPDKTLSRMKEFVDKKPHPGIGRLRRQFGIVGKSSPVAYRYVAIKMLSAPSSAGNTLAPKMSAIKNSSTP
jgi:hypothetical protein